MKTITFSLLPAIFLWLGSCCIASAQVAQSDQIINDSTNQIIQADSSATGKFRPVTVAPSATSDIILQFPTSQGGKTIAIEPLDGGQPSINSASIGLTGQLSFSFTVTAQPGIYRTIVIDPNASDASLKFLGLVQFAVPNPTK